MQILNPQDNITFMSTPSYCCPRCGKQIGWLGRLFNAIIPGWHQCPLQQFYTLRGSTMTQDHPITPPPELVEQWADIWYQAKVRHVDITGFVARQAARWGADTELDACCEWLEDHDCDDPQEAAKHLRTARRPKPPSLKEQALEELGQISISPELGITYSTLDTIRRALESLPND